MVINDYQLSKLTTNYLAHGINAICFKVGDKVFKKYGVGTDEDISNGIKYLTCFKSHLISFPEKLLYLDSEKPHNFVGYLMNYIDGNVLYKVNDQENINEFVSGLVALEQEIKRLSEMGLLMWDINQGNIIYQNGVASLIDTDLYEQSMLESIDIYKSNLKQLGWALYDLLLRNHSFNNDNIEHYKNLCLNHGKLKPSYLFSEIINEEEKVSKESIVTFNDFDKKLVLIKK